MAELTRCSKCGGQMNCYSSRPYPESNVRIRKYRCADCGEVQCTDEPFCPVDVIQFVSVDGLLVRQIKPVKGE